MKKLYIEGTADTDNGSLKIAFARFLEKELKGNLPRIVMGDGRSQTIAKFCATPLMQGEERFLLVDSDKFPFDRSEEFRQFMEAIPNVVTKCTDDNTFFMIQEVESWILSQPDVLKRQVGINVPEHPTAYLLSMHKPSEQLQKHYKSQHKNYHKVSEFIKILPQIDTKKLSDDFEDFKNLIAALK